MADLVMWRAGCCRRGAGTFDMTMVMRMNMIGPNNCENVATLSLHALMARLDSMACSCWPKRARPCIAV